MNTLIATVAIIVAVPLLMIWAINTLFGLGIAYTLSTWAAALVLGVVVGGSSTCKK